MTRQIAVERPLRGVAASAGLEEGGPTNPPARWQRGADRLARYAWLVLLVAVALALVGGIIDAATWQPRTDPVPSRLDECANPPCFGGGGLPGVRDLPSVLPLLGYLLVILLSLPSLFAGTWDVLRGRGAVGGRRLLAFVGPVLVFAGAEIVPHLLNPCYFAAEFGGRRLPEFYCQYNPEWGADFADRWHTLDHALVGALPLVTLYGLALRRWHPTIVRFR